MNVVLSLLPGGGEDGWRASMTIASVRLLVFVLVIGLGQPSLAQQPHFEDARSVRLLYNYCNSINLDFCNGFLYGVASTLDNNRKYNGKWSENYCPPNSVRIESLRSIFVQWAERSQNWAADPFDGALMAFAIKFFCPIR